MGSIPGLAQWVKGSGTAAAVVWVTTAVRIRSLARNSLCLGVAKEEKKDEKEHKKWPHKGHKRSEECKQKIREANLGKKQSKETIEKRAKKLKGKCGKYERTDEWKNNLSKAKKGKKLKLSEERRKELSQRASERNTLYGHF